MAFLYIEIIISKERSAFVYICFAQKQKKNPTMESNSCHITIKPNL